jgi:hypothetical protein
MWAQAGLDDNQYLLLDYITYHRTTNEAVSVNECIIVKDGIKYPHRTTKGWGLHIMWKYVMTTWE